MAQSQSYDAIIIGAGIIGAATALALGRKGWKPLCLDRLPASGYGSTSGSCAIIRPYYSTVDGSAIAYESHFYWDNWSEFLGAEDERGHARYVNCGNLILKTEGNSFLEPILKIMDELEVPYEDLSPEQAVEAMIKPATKGYLSPETAAEQALQDIKAHEIAMVTGMEAALKGVLRKLDPKELEGKIEVSGAFGSLLKGKKARYWEVYEKIYAEISDQAENDFQDLFSREFARAYKEQLDKLKR